MNSNSTVASFDFSGLEPTIQSILTGDKVYYKCFGECRGELYLDVAMMLFPETDWTKYDTNKIRTTAIE